MYNPISSNFGASAGPATGSCASNGPVGHGSGGLEMAEEKHNVYLPPANVTMTPEAIAARIEELKTLRDEAHFEAVFHAFSDDESSREASEWQDELDEALEAWRELLTKASVASSKSMRANGDRPGRGGPPRPVRWWEALVRVAAKARRRGEAELRKHRRK